MADRDLLITSGSGIGYRKAAGSSGIQVGATLGASGSTLIISPASDTPYAMRAAKVDGTYMLTFDTQNGRLYIGMGTPTARVHLPAGTATAGSAPLKLMPGTLTSTPSDGALEYDGSNLHFSIGSTRYKVSGQILGRTDNTAPFVTALGSGAATTNAGTNLTAFGYMAGQSTGSAANSVYVGAFAGQNCTGSRNVGIGYSALRYATGNDLVALGYESGQYISNNGCVAVGYHAMYSTSAATFGNNSIAIGNGSTTEDTTAEHNIAIGNTAYTSGARSIAIGHLATAGAYSVSIGRGGFGAPKPYPTHCVYLGWKAGSNESGNRNVIIGASAGKQTTPNATGTDNVIIGYLAANAETSASYNVIIGYQACRDTLSTGSYMVSVAPGDNATSSASGGISIGYEAHHSYGSTGGNTVSIGYLARSGPAGSIAIGYQAEANTTAGNIQLGTGTNSRATRSLQVGAATTNPYDVYAQSFGGYSDARLKKDVRTLAPEACLQLIQGLRPVSFKYKYADPSEYAQRRAYGFIAQEVKQVFESQGWPASRVWTEDEEAWGIDYASLVAPLVGAIQAMANELDELEAELAALEAS